MYQEELGISVIVSTNKKIYMDNIIKNYSRQNLKKKELILILNRNDLRVQEFEQYMKTDSSIHIYSLPEEITLGSCLNYAIGKSRYQFVSKMDDDDFYGESYLQDIYEGLIQGKGEIVGKPGYLIYYYDDQILSVRKSGPYDCETYTIQGSSISFSKDTFQKVQFRDLNIGEDYHFIKDAQKLGCRVYATSKYGYLYIRYKDLDLHTWKTEAERCKDTYYYNVLPRITYEQAIAYTYPENDMLG